MKLIKKFLFFYVLLSFVSFSLRPSYAIGTAGVLSGRAVDKDTKKGVEGVSVTAKSPSETYTASTDATGFFSIAGVPAGIYELTLERVGFQMATVSNVMVTGDATTNLVFMLSAVPVLVPGVTVSAPRAPIANPRQTMTNYGYWANDMQKIYPGPESLSVPAIYENLPGVQTGYDAYYGAASPHIRGGTGSDIGYAFDGVPVYEPITNNHGTNLVSVGSGRSDFYVGGYPAQYGNFLSGFVNQVMPRGSGPMHGNIEYEYGFWLDPGSRLPSYDTATGANPTYNGAPYYSPTNIKIELQGKDRRFSYYFNHILQSGGAQIGYNGLVPYAFGSDVKPYIVEYAALQDAIQARDTVLNLHYDLDPYNDLQLLFYTGIGKAGFAGFQELPCNPAKTTGTCVGGSSSTGFNETYNAFNIAPLPDANENNSFDLEKFEWSHRFASPGKLLNLRLWEYNPSVFFNLFSQPVTLWEFRRSAEKGGLLEYQNQMTPQHLVNAGASYVYSNNFLISDSNNIGVPAGGPGYFASGQGLIYPGPTTSNFLHSQAIPDTRTLGAWITDEWRPTEKWDVYAGLRYDAQTYLLVPGVNGNPISITLPGYANGTPEDPGFTHPGFISPRAGASYRLSDKLTLKASYGKFTTFAPARRIEILTGAADGGSATYNQGISKFAAGFAPPTGTATVSFGALCPDPAGCYKFPGGTSEWLPGSKTQIGETTDVSWEYQLDDNTLLKLTPYIKHIKDPLQTVTVNGQATFVNSGTIESKGIEFYLKSHDWHGLSGWLSYTYSITNGSELPNQAGLENTPVFFCSPALGCSASGAFSAAQQLADLAQVVPTAYDQRHILSLNLDYKLGNWEFAPNFKYGSGYPYGLGLGNLQALAAFQDPASFLYGGAHTVAQSVALVPGFNPLNESAFNGLRQPAWWLGNLAVTYHINPNLDAILNVFNVFNSNQVLDSDNSVSGGIGYVELTNPNLVHSAAFLRPCCYTSNDGSKNILPQYNPMLGQYAPFGYPNLRQFFLTMRYTY